MSLLLYVVCAVFIVWCVGLLLVVAWCCDVMWLGCCWVWLDLVCGAARCVVLCCARVVSRFALFCNVLLCDACSVALLYVMLSAWRGVALGVACVLSAF